MSRKLRKALIIIFAAVLVLGGTALAVLYYMGDRIIEEAIKDEISLETSESGQALQTDGSDGTGTVETSGTASTDSQQQTDTSNPNLSGEQTSGSSEKITSNKKTSKKKSAVIAESKIAEIKKEVTAEDKISAAALILKRLSADDINALKNMLAGGLSTEEKEKAKRLAYSRFTSAELAEIKEMYEKYMD